MQSIIKRKLGIRLGKVIIPPLLYQDDIMFASISIEKMQEMLNIAERFQKQNLLNFNLDKSETMKMTFGNKKRSRTDKLKLNGETLNEVAKYKYLGDLKNNKGTLEDGINTRKYSAKGVINEIKFLISQPAFKKQGMEISIKLIECILIPKILYGYETWTNISNKMLKELENIQKDAITIINSIPKSTPYKGMLYECGLMPMAYRIKLKRLSYLHKVLNMKETRLTNKVYQEQKRLGLKNCWYDEVMSDLNELNIQLNEEEIKHLSSDGWKQILHSKIIEQIEDEVQNNNKTKLRFIKYGKFKMKDYIKHKDEAMLLKLKLNIWMI